ncbi:hypothetical protein Tco_0497937 [Tanacetum coccineum]
MQCALCRNGMDSHLQVYFSKRTGNALKKDSKISLQSNIWKDNVGHMASLPNGNNMWSVNVWLERNRRLFQNIGTDWDKLDSAIKNEVRMKLSCLEVKQSNNVKEVANLWDGFKAFGMTHPSGGVSFLLSEEESGPKIFNPT